MSATGPLRRLLGLLTYPGSLRLALMRRILRDSRWISLDSLLTLSALTRPAYTYCIYHAARLARQLGIRRISALEFGVAGGNGLVACERIAARVREATGVEVELYGFDTGKGLPEPDGVRDLPYWYRGNLYPMDVAGLRARLETAVLVLGDVQETVGRFFAEHDPAPVGAVLQDLDYHSSTVAALRLFDAPAERFLPRCFLYFDDVLGSAWEMFGPLHGELRAIEEFNRDHAAKRILKNRNLVAGEPYRQPWHHKIFYYHDLEHPLYDRYIGGKAQDSMERALLLDPS